MRSMLLVSLLVAASVACAAAPESESSSAQASSESERATAALRAVGAKVPGTSSQCQRCHDMSQATVRRWGEDFGRTFATLTDTNASRASRQAALRLDPADPSSGYGPHRLGFVAALAGIASAEATGPVTRALSRAIEDAFPDGTEREAFRRAVRMPARDDFAGLSPAEAEALASWAKDGMPKLAEMLPDGERPTRCTEDLSGLREHILRMRTTSWATVNRDAQLPMFACPDGASSPRDCFRQTFSGQPIFPEAKDTSFGRSWSADGSTLRVLRAFDFQTYFWLRTSADGRFVANGVSRRGQDGGVISDLAASLDPSGPKSRDIWVDAKYDPDFWPDNRGFMYQGTEGGASYCAQSLLEDPATTRVTFREPSCSRLDALGLYQTVGRTSGDDALANMFVVNSKFVNDNGGNGQEIMPATFGPDAAIVVHTLETLGTDAGGYRVARSDVIPTPYEGDTMVSRSTSITASRIAGVRGQLGYAFRRLDTRTSPPTLTRVGTLCMDGSKANFSYDERFLVTQQYRFGARDQSVPEGSDIWLVDLLTGKRVRVTKTSGGQFALYPHFRSDGWLLFLVRDGRKSWVVASDAALRMAEATP